jgi:hypothetical protein
MGARALRDRLDVMVEAGLRDEGVGEACPVASPQKARAEQASSFPIPFRHIEQGQLHEESLDRPWHGWIARQFREGDGREDGLPVLECDPGQDGEAADAVMQYGIDTGYGGEFYGKPPGSLPRARWARAMALRMVT